MTRGYIRPSTRQDDERHLQWLRWRACGFTTPAIARVSNYTESHIRTATNRIKAADMIESGEPAAIVRRDYW